MLLLTPKDFFFNRELIIICLHQYSPTRGMWCRGRGGKYVNSNENIHLIIRLSVN